MTRYWSLLLAAVAAAALVAAPLGAAEAPAVPTLLGSDDPVPLPSVWRVVFAFAVTAGLALALAYALQRWLPRLAGKLGTRAPLSSPFKVIGRGSIHNGLRLHLVEVAGQTVLVVEGKSGVSATPLGSSDSVSKQVP